MFVSVVRKSSCWLHLRNKRWVRVHRELHQSSPFFILILSTCRLPLIHLQCIQIMLGHNDNMWAVMAINGSINDNVKAATRSQRCTMIHCDVQTVQCEWVAGHTGHVMRCDKALKQYGIRRRMCFCSAWTKGWNPVIFIGQHFGATINRKQLIQRVDVRDDLSPPAHLTLSSSSSSEVSGAHFTASAKVPITHPPHTHRHKHKELLSH